MSQRNTSTKSKKDSKNVLTVATNNTGQDMKRLNSSTKSCIDFMRDYQPRRLGVKKLEKIIVLEYMIPSTTKRYHHYIKLSKYH